MADSTLNRFLASGTTAERSAFTPTPPTPSSGPDFGYAWYDTDDGLLYSWDGSAWQAPAGSGTVTNTGTLTASQLIQGNGGADVSTISNTAATALLDAMVGDSGSGGTKGLVPAPAAGDAAAGKFLKADGTWTAPSSGGGAVVQVVNTQTGAVATGTTTIPFDDTIPQNTEGTEFMTRAITPTSATNKLRIDITVFVTATNTPWMIVALFQDSTADALAAQALFNGLSTAGGMVTLTHYMTAGTTSATTFKVRIGASSASTITFNGQSGGRIFGGVMASSITITEIVP